ncbi:MAG TPA: metallophosphoesterase [Ktedonobacteraceae bacterium]|nr:metallophosphoesterase [Ktedonobacteraceae bacterium]
MPENNAGEDLEQSLASDPEQQRIQGVITVVLTADNHLGYTAFAQHPRKREERRQQLRQAFQRATDFAVGQGVDLFIQAGDLFDTASPDERDRSFVAERLAQLRQAGIRTFALGGMHDTPIDTHHPAWGAGTLPGGQVTELSEVAPAPQISYARLGALHYFAPHSPSTAELEPVMVDVRDLRLAICGLGVLADQEGNPLAQLRVRDDIARASITLLILHAPIEGLGSSLLDGRAQVSRASIATQSVFDYIVAGYHHEYRRLRIGHCNVIVAGATQRLDFSDPDDDPGFVFLGLAADGIRWCNHIAVDSLPLRRLVIQTSELSSAGTDFVIERLRPLCDAHAMVQLRLEGELTRRQYHQLDLNQIRRYGEEHCFALAIDDSALSLVSTDSSLADGTQEVWSTSEQAAPAESAERLSLHEELVALADEWLTAAQNEQEKKALQATKEELLAALDEGKERR